MARWSSLPRPPYDQREAVCSRWSVVISTSSISVGWLDQRAVARNGDPSFKGDLLRSRIGVRLGSADSGGISQYVSTPAVRVRFTFHLSLCSLR